jgi:hypothetical protein
LFNNNILENSITLYYNYPQFLLIFIVIYLIKNNNHGHKNYNYIISDKMANFFLNLIQFKVLQEKSNLWSKRLQFMQESVTKDA